MVETENEDELLFFDTFSHDIHEKFNLDLVQFPRAVFIHEVRIIPLGARVQADFPGGVRLGATNPSAFEIEFFVNDLSKSGAPTFDCLGSFSYNQNNRIHLNHLNCKSAEVARNIPTDGLVLKGWYTTITLAVYGTLSGGVVGSIASPTPTADNAIKITSNDNKIYDNCNEIRDWDPQSSKPDESYNNFQENFDYPQHPVQQPHFVSTPDPMENSACDPTVSSTIADDLKDEPNHSPGYRYSSNSPSKEVDHKNKREWSNSPTEYRHSKRSRVSSYENNHYESPRAERQREREHRRAPRTPPMESPRVSRPRSPSNSDKGLENDSLVIPDQSTIVDESSPSKHHGDEDCPSSPSNNTPIESPVVEMEDDVTAEQFEPILSDDDISDDGQDDLQFEELIVKSFNPYAGALKKVILPENIDNSKFQKIHDQLVKLGTFFQAAYKPNLDDPKCCATDHWVNFSEDVMQALLQLQITGSISDRTKFMECLEEKEIEMIFYCVKLGLNFDYAMRQQKPGYNLRHLKAALRLSESLSWFGGFLENFQCEKYDIFGQLLELFGMQIIPLPIKLIVMKLIYKLIDTKQGVDLLKAVSGYNSLVTMFDRVHDIRLMFILKSILRKIHLYETLQVISETTLEICGEPNTDNCRQVELLEQLFATLLESKATDGMLFAQPKRFLPIAHQFEIVQEVKHIDLVAYYKIHNFREAVLLLLNIRQNLSLKLNGYILEIVRQLIVNPLEMAYICEDILMLNVFAKELVQVNGIDEMDESFVGTINTHTELGVELAYKVETKYFLDSITHCNAKPEELAEHLLSLYSLCISPGRKFVLETICTDDHLPELLNLIELEKKANVKEGSPSVKLRSPISMTIVDIVDCLVRFAENLDYLTKHSNVLLNLVKKHDTFEPSVGATLQELAVFLKPIEIEDVFQYNDITPLVDFLKRSMEFIATFPGDLIMTMRVLKYLLIHENKGEYQEFKYKYFVLQFYSADGITMLVSVLDKLTSHFEQPAMHSYLLATSQGVLLLQILNPAIFILKQLLLNVIRTRSVEFKDITAVSSLMKTYTLLNSVTTRSLVHHEAQLLKKEIVQILLIYTQTAAPDGVAAGNIFKSLWTMMLGEVVQYTVNELFHLVPGLMVLSSLLPLPLPVLTQKPLSKLESVRLITERQIWSAHLHPQSQLLIELIQTTCTTSCAQLLQIVNRVCVQLSDLAPNMSLLVSKAIVERILQEPLQANNLATLNLSRLMHFLSNLLSYSSIKVSVLSILPGRFMDLLSHILISIHDDVEAHVQCQEHVLIILHNLFDCEISMLFNSNHSSELILASGLPSKESMVVLLSNMIENFCNSDQVNLKLAVVRVFLLMTEYDVTISILKSSLQSIKSKFNEKISQIVSSYQNEKKNQLLVPGLLEFFRATAEIDLQAPNLNLPRRSITLSSAELASIIDYKTGEDHFLLKLKKELNTSPESPVEPTPDLEKNIDSDSSSDVKELRKNLEFLLTFLDIKSEKSALTDQEVSLPQAEGIVTQFALRLSHTIVTENVDEQLIHSYWNEEVEEGPLDQVECDLTELIRTCLPHETNITSDCKRLLNLSASPQTTRDRAQLGLCFRARRVELEPTTGRPEKKIFGKYPPRGRGFPRSTMTRGDLFRSRPPNTSRPPSLHVDDFLAMESVGGSSSYNKRETIPIPRGRGRGFIHRGRGTVSSTSSNWSSASSRSIIPHDPSKSHYSSAHHYPVRGLRRPRRYPR